MNRQTYDVKIYTLKAREMVAESVMQLRADGSHGKKNAPQRFKNAKPGIALF